jgi:hypothetical protein
MLFKHGESPSLEMSILSDLSARSWVWPGRDQNNVAIVKSKPLNAGEISLIACQYNSNEQKTQMWLNGASQQEAEAKIELRPCAQAFLGSHSDLSINAYFFGNMYEVVVYDGIFDEESLQKMTSYFKDRYQIGTIDSEIAN